jgi:hypothetical protein
MSRGSSGKHANHQTTEGFLLSFKQSKFTTMPTECQLYRSIMAEASFSVACSHLAFFYNVKRITVPKSSAHLISIALHHFITESYVALVSFSSQNFARQPCWHCRLPEMKKYDFRTATNGKILLNLIKIRSPILELNLTDKRRQRDRHGQPHAFISRTLT